MYQGIIPITYPKMLNSKNPETALAVDTMINGRYVIEVSIQPQLDYCLRNTRSFPPLYNYKYEREKLIGNKQCCIEMKIETTIDACYRLVVNEKKENVCALNFANAFHPGGGVSGFAVAQEEESCRASALYYSLVQQPGFYEYHKNKGSNEASDYIIFSPEVPIWKTSKGVLFEPFTASFITAAAVDCRSGPNERAAEINDHRIKVILECAIENGVNHLILGAFGCGAFRNSPYDVANSFKKYLVEENMMSFFDSVVFSFNVESQNSKVFSEVFSEFLTDP